MLTDGGIETLRSDGIKVGDVLRLKKDQRVPADGLLLHTSDEFGTVFIRTDQLDGETDWKVKEAVRCTHRLAESTPVALLHTKWTVVAEAPSDSIYSFGGNFFGPNGAFEPLRVEHMVWANSRVASGEVYLLVVYTGLETRMSLNSKRQIQKFGRTDEEINRLFKATFLILTLVSLVMFFASGYEFHMSYWVEVVRIFAILSTLLPFMLKLNVDFAKLFYSHQINKDNMIEGTIVRNRQIPEELGRVEYLLSDKTGTLTRNEMVFKELRTLFGSFSTETFKGLKDRLTDLYNRGGFMETPEEASLKLTLIGLILCNNVSPTWNDDQRTLQASSPDEIALVNFVESIGYFMESRRTNQITIRNPAGKKEMYEVMENFPFSSERMRMGIVLRNLETEQMYFFLKGADVALQRKLRSDEGIFSQEQTEALSKEGLRTLVLSYKILSQKELADWRVEFKRASQNLSQRVELERICVENLERNITFLAVTGVEDLLQEDIKIAITTIRSAGIKVWMLTGDKLETAKCIAISTGFKAQNQRFFEIIDSESESLHRALERYKPDEAVMVVSGACMQLIFTNAKLKRVFFAKAMRAKSVVFCRCAPKQKAEITLILKQEHQKVVCCIGDGGNDVGMIQSASVGIGIEGKEGLQASLASDFSIRQFKNILHLFLWHGRLSYVRTSTLSLLVIHRGFILTTVQYIFMAGLYFITMNIYNGYLNMFYGTVFTNLVVFSMVFDEDIPKHQAFNYPQLYREIQEGGLLTAKTFLIWTAKAIFQGSAIILLAMLVFPSALYQLGTISFTALICVEYLTIVLVVRTWHKAMLLGLLLSLLSYLFCLVFLKDLFRLVEMSAIDYLKTLALVACAWLPIALARLVQRCALPTNVDKIMNEVKTQEKRKNYIK